MKRFFTFLITGLFLTVPILAQGTVDNAETVAEPIAYINAVEGEAFFRNFEKVELNIIVGEGEEINTTADGRVEILLKGGGVIRLDRNTRIVFVALTDQMIILEAWNGNIYVEKGELEIGIKSPSRSLNLSQSEWYFTEPEKSFKKWNNARNEELTPDEQYLPKELGRYGNTLNHCGYWRHISSYGYCWIPRVAYGWSPYLYGRWDWYHSHRMWISYDPFGWCTHHYGRWHWHSTWGWYWIPTSTWGPAWVLWSILSDCIGWSPLWYGGYDSYYYRHYYRDYYGYSYSRAWTFIPGNRLGSRGSVAKHVIHKNELKRRIPGSISSNQLRTSFSAAATGSISKSTARISPIQSRQVRSKITNTYSSRTKIPTQRQKISKSRVTPSATSVRTSYRSRSSKIISRSSARKSFSSRASISSSRKLLISRSSKSIPRSSSRSTQSRKAVKKKR